MDRSSRLTLADDFGTLDARRVERIKLRPLLSIVSMAICAVISSSES